MTKVHCISLALLLAFPALARPRVQPIYLCSVEAVERTGPTTANIWFFPRGRGVGMVIAPGANVPDFRFDLGDGVITVEGKDLEALKLERGKDAILYSGTHSYCSFKWEAQEGQPGIGVTGVGTWPGDGPKETKVFAPFDVE